MTLTALDLHVRCHKRLSKTRIKIHEVFLMTLIKVVANIVSK